MFSIRLQELMRKKNLSITQLSKALGINHSTLRGWLKHSKSPRYKNIIRVARYFNVTVDYLLGIIDRDDITYPANEVMPVSPCLRELLLTCHDMDKEKIEKVAHVAKFIESENNDN